MAGHSRNWWLHESEHLLVVALLVVVLLQAGQMTGGDAGIGGNPLIIVPGQDAFTVGAGETVRYPWLVVNRADRSIRVKSGLGLEWRTGTHNVSATAPDGMTALLVEPSSAETTALEPGDHRTYRYTFTAPERPGRYTITLVAVGNGANVRETVAMRVMGGGRS
jgi:hypothetical protein